MKLQYTQFSDKGPRTNNEDCCGIADIDEHRRMFIVCDGMGGHACGEVASKTVCDTFISFWKDHPNENDSEQRILDATRMDNQGTVANIAREQVKEYLRKHQPFVWNATNITLQMRESLVSLLETYHAHVRIVYLESQWVTLLERNSQREHMVPIKVIKEKLGKLTLPESFEAKTVEWMQ